MYAWANITGGILHCFIYLLQLHVYYPLCLHEQLSYLLNILLFAYCGCE
jgi:hypothetical protein